MIPPGPEMKTLKYTARIASEALARVQTLNMKSTYWTIGAGVVLVAPAYCGLMLTGVPTLLCPFPTATIIPAFVLSSSRLEWLAVAIPPVLFFQWNPSLLRGQSTVPKRSLALLTVLTVLSIVFFVGSWEWGLKYQGPRFTYGVCAANFGWLMLLWVVFVRGWRKPSFFNNLLAHWLLFAWLGWYAFPYLGELP
jgi:hypothetical protein